MKRTPRPNRGYSIVEMMAAVLIISFGLIGLLTLQSRALMVSVTSEDAQRAILLAEDLAAEMRNVNNVNVGATWLNDWTVRVADPAQGGLPGGVGTVTVQAANRAQITVTWTPPQTAGGANDTHNFTTHVVLAQ